MHILAITWNETAEAAIYFYVQTQLKTHTLTFFQKEDAVYIQAIIRTRDAIKEEIKNVLTAHYRDDVQDTEKKYNIHIERCWKLNNEHQVKMIFYENIHQCWHTTSMDLKNSAKTISPIITLEPGSTFQSLSYETGRRQRSQAILAQNLDHYISRAHLSRHLIQRRTLIIEEFVAHENTLNPCTDEPGR